jgi:hypothetical protein
VVIEGQRLKSRQEARRVEVSETGERADHRWLPPLRSAGLLGLLLTGLGVAVAAVVGLVALGLAALIDQALG